MTFPDEVQRTFQAFLASVASGDPEAFKACLSPSIRLYGAFLGREVQGVEAAMKAFRDIRPAVGLARIRVLRSFGRDLEMAALCAFELEGRANPSDAVILLCFDREGRIERLAALWDPGFTLAPSEMAIVESQFLAYNAGDAEAFLRSMAQDVEYYGTMTGVEVVGIPSVRGAFRGARETMGVRSLEALHIFGRPPYLGVHTRFRGEGGHPASEGVIALLLDATGHIARFSVVWDPKPFLAG